MDGQVEAHEFGELWVFVTKHGREVVAPVLVDIDGAHTCAVAIQVSIDHCRNNRQLCDQIHCVFVNVLKVRTCTVKRVGNVSWNANQNFFVFVVRTSQYVAFLAPSWYACANLLTELQAIMAAENCAIG